ncbi:hypothetical protein VE03_02487 [Pseudogymnoascus sp. 23342-1-I1]|nr:hypothetical protein VE03_02487 [Pseudogymnoascus sp. 23342-1-I1]
MGAIYSVDGIRGNGMKDVIPESQDVEQDTKKNPGLAIDAALGIGTEFSSDCSLRKKGFASISISLIHAAVKPGVLANAFGAVTMYQAQITIYQSAIQKLHLDCHDVGYNTILIGTTDSMEGAEGAYSQGVCCNKSLAAVIQCFSVILITTAILAATTTPVTATTLATVDAPSYFPKNAVEIVVAELGDIFDFAIFFYHDLAR